jgi:carboxyl-terminal processing protease
MKKRSFWQPLLILSIIIFSIFSQISPALAFTSFNDEQKLVLQAWRLVNQAYLDESFNNQDWWRVREKFSQKTLENRQDAYLAIEEMLKTLDEPFTRLLRPDQYKNLQISTSGELSGIGLQITINPENQQLEVVSPLEGSPAKVAGIAPHDHILQIDGIDTTKMSLDEAAGKMRGTKGTTISLTIQPKNQDQGIRTIQLVRDRIQLSPVISNLDNQSSSLPIGYIRLTQFSANATEELAKSIKELNSEGAKAYILDLRNNPGGLLQAGIDIARLFLNEGVIVHTVNRQSISESYNANGTALTKAPLAVLVNQGTASSSEVLAGALQDNGRAILVGEKTYGKALIQSLFELSDVINEEKAGLAVSVAKYQTPNHRDIHKLGIQPNIKIENELISTENKQPIDKQYQAAVKVLTNLDNLAHSTETKSS